MKSRLFVAPTKLTWCDIFRSPSSALPDGLSKDAKNVEAISFPIDTTNEMTEETGCRIKSGMTRSLAETRILTDMTKAVAKKHILH